MSNVSGIGQNKSYRGSVPAKDPYYYIRAQLDLTGIKANDVHLYFNKDNSFAYLNTAVNAYPNPDNYPKYITIDDNSLVGEVTVYSNSDLAFSEGESNTIASGSDLVNVERSSGVAKLTLSASVVNVFKLRVGDLIKVSGVTNDPGGFNTSGFVAITGISGVNGEILEYNDAGLDFPSAPATGTTKLLEGQIIVQVGGSSTPSTPFTVMNLWAGPTGNVPGNILLSELADSQICYYGTEPLLPYLSLRLAGGNSTNVITSGTLFVVVKVYKKPY